MLQNNFLCDLLCFSFVCVHVYAYAFKSKVYCWNAFGPGASGLPGHTASEGALAPQPPHTTRIPPEPIQISCFFVFVFSAVAQRDFRGSWLKNHTIFNCCVQKSDIEGCTEITANNRRVYSSIITMSKYILLFLKSL